MLSEMGQVALNRAARRFLTSCNEWHSNPAFAVLRLPHRVGESLRPTSMVLGGIAGELVHHRPVRANSDVTNLQGDQKRRAGT
jgi:hypothetical protein